MSRECFEIGTLQAFLDGETGPEMSTRISDHILECDGCALQLANAEEETAAVFSALDRELNTLVPTQRLWTRINETIETERSHASIWQRAYAFIAVYVASPSFAAAAGILLFVGIFAFVWTSNTVETPNGDIAQSVPAGQGTAQTGQIVASNVPAATPSSKVGDGVDVQLPPIDTPRSDRRTAAMTASYRTDDRSARRNAQPDVRPVTLQYIPGEESYIRTIDELNGTVASQKDRVLPVSSRVAFERDLAVVDDAIKRNKENVRKNPNNQAARQVLYAAYQDKIDLLNSVGQREELMASLR